MNDIHEIFNIEVDNAAISRPVIPDSAYQKIQRCPSCQSIYLTDSKCEACGRSLLYHPIGDPFSSKSLYGFKERYYASFPLLVKFFPFFENKMGAMASTYRRQLFKRFTDLLNAFGTSDSIPNENRRFFYIEILELIDELLRYGENPKIIQSKIEEEVMEIGSLLSGKMLGYLNESKLENKITKPWIIQILNERIMGGRVEFWLKSIIVTTTIVTLSIVYFELINSQVGK